MLNVIIRIFESLENCLQSLRRSSCGAKRLGYNVLALPRYLNYPESQTAKHPLTIQVLATVGWRPPPEHLALLSHRNLTKLRICRPFRSPSPRICLHILDLRVLSVFPSSFELSQGTEEAERKLVARCIDKDPSAGGLLDLQPEAEAGSHNVAGRESRSR